MLVSLNFQGLKELEGLEDKAKADRAFQLVWFELTIVTLNPKLIVVTPYEVVYG